MKVATEDVDVRSQGPRAPLRQRRNFGSASGYTRISGEYFSISAGVDTTPLFEGLPGNLCQSPHWGYVLKGSLTTTDAEGARETVTSGDLFYWPPGHNVRVDADAEIVMFSPEHEHTEVLDHMKTKLSA
jgi:uncharacterized cupin superfamily protein